MPLITDEYRQLLVQHREEKNPRWGNGGGPHLQPITEIVHALPKQERPKSVLDYGCGHGFLLRSLVAQRVFNEQFAQFYDPGIPEFSAPPSPADMVISTDCLEHIEPDCLPDVLEHIRSLTNQLAYLMVHTGPANAVLPDGRNAHLIQEDPSWWQAQLMLHYPSVERIKGGGPIRPRFLCRV